MKRSYEIGDTVWIYVGEKREKGDALLSKGTVVHKFITEWRALEQYVVLLDDPDFVAMEIRDAFLMTDNPDALPAYMQATRAQLK